MLGRQPTAREFDELAAELAARGDVDNPYALANWILTRRYASNPGPPLRWSRRGGGGLRLVHLGAAFELQRADVADELERGWHGWALVADGDPVLAFQLPTDALDAARAVADEWIGVWAMEWIDAVSPTR